VGQVEGLVGKFPPALCMVKIMSCILLLLFHSNFIEKKSGPVYRFQYGTLQFGSDFVFTGHAVLKCYVDC